MANPILWSDVTAIADELSAVSATAQTLILAHVNADLDVDQFDGEDGPTTKLARAYLAAHLGTFAMPGAGSVSGPVTSQSALGLSRSYGQTGASSGELGLTAHGQMFLLLAKQSFARLPVLI